MNRFALLALLFAGCGVRNWELLEGKPASTPTAGAGVILYGVEDAGDPPPSCHKLGVVRAWSSGEKTFPYDGLRGAAAELGGDSVIDLHPDPAGPPKRPTWLGTVARCR
ncbi:MAG: hypothetical protein JNL79_31025 [Myxococcales bacterium]|nr:hypothetical protein [Myxococcales bacterium]